MYWAGLGSNSRTLDQQSDSLPIALQGTMYIIAISLDGIRYTGNMQTCHFVEIQIYFSNISRIGLTIYLKNKLFKTGVDVTVARNIYKI